MQLDIGNGIILTEIEHPEPVYDIFKELNCLHDLMVEFNITPQDLDTSSVSRMLEKPVGEDSIQQGPDGINANERQQKYMRTLAILGSSGLGATGFLINPLLGIGGIVACGSIGWFITRKKTVDRILHTYNSETPQ